MLARYHYISYGLVSVRLSVTRRYYIETAEGIALVFGKEAALELSYIVLKGIRVRCNPDNCIGAVQPSFMLLSGVCDYAEAYLHASSVTKRSPAACSKSSKPRKQTGLWSARIVADCSAIRPSPVHLQLHLQRDSPPSVSSATLAYAVPPRMNALQSSSVIGS